MEPPFSDLDANEVRAVIERLVQEYGWTVAALLATTVALFVVARSITRQLRYARLAEGAPMPFS
ncbi:hypothetical protein EDD27_3932 [Nonomuraea polychroma]|uniref:Uncharacterized protein n=1 Tax=Nonomuraea polychroma TaxID=46176 RepID=A0A438M724_9ACTN|nr:hypothetical protein [Nonomuraea polychroma]RVX41405.1 hypothetical protein EDD27_3932 [Nonomuraea polychroma]